MSSTDMSGNKSSNALPIALACFAGLSMLVFLLWMTWYIYPSRSFGKGLARSNSQTHHAWPSSVLFDAIEMGTATLPLHAQKKPHIRYLGSPPTWHHVNSGRNTILPTEACPSHSTSLPANQNQVQKPVKTTSPQNPFTTTIPNRLIISTPQISADLEARLTRKYHLNGKPPIRSPRRPSHRKAFAMSRFIPLDKLDEHIVAVELPPSYRDVTSLKSPVSPAIQGSFKSPTSVFGFVLKPLKRFSEMTVFKVHPGSEVSV